jgi:hypothetical protein
VDDADTSIAAHVSSGSSDVVVKPTTRFGRCALDQFPKDGSNGPSDHNWYPDVRQNVCQKGKKRSHWKYLKWIISIIPSKTGYPETDAALVSIFQGHEGRTDCRSTQIENWIY